MLYNQITIQLIKSSTHIMYKFLTNLTIVKFIKKLNDKLYKNTFSVFISIIFLDLRAIPNLESLTGNIHGGNTD
jgi:hypothetical protein